MAGGNFNFPPTGKRENTDCEDLIIITNVATPEDNLFNELTVEQILKVKLLEQDRAIGLFTKEDIYIGSILDPKVIELIKCLKSGKLFNAVIKTIEEAFIEVFIFCQKESKSL